MPSDIPQSVFGEEFPKDMHRMTIEVDCEHKEKMRHEGRRGKFTWYSDEPPRIGGEDNHPQPLSYIAGGVGF